MCVRWADRIECLRSAASVTPAKQSVLRARPIAGLVQVVKALGVAEENKKRKSAIAVGQPAKRPFLDALDVSDSDDEAESE